LCVIVGLSVYFILYHPRTPGSYEGYVCESINTNKHNIVFNVSSEYKWDSFEKLLDSNGVKTSKYNLVILELEDDVIFTLKKGVHVTLNLEKNGRFLLNKGGCCTFKGENNTLFTIINGKALDSGGTIRQEEGTFEIIGTSLYCKNSEAEFGGGAYFIEGNLTLLNNDVSVSKLYFIDCNATKKAGGGLNVWNATLNLCSDGVGIGCIRCTTSHHGAGFIMFMGHLGFIGNNTYILADMCEAGDRAGGIEFDGAQYWNINKEMVIDVKGNNCRLEANNSSSGGNNPSIILMSRGHIYGDHKLNIVASYNKINKGCVVNTRTLFRHNNNITYKVDEDQCLSGVKCVCN